MRVYPLPVIIHLITVFCLLINTQGIAQGESELNKITVRSVIAGGTVYMLDCENGFGGGNVAASVGTDGILLVDDMFREITPKLLEALKKLSPAGVRMVVDSHFHGDHIAGNAVLSGSAIIIAQENMLRRFKENKPAWVVSETFPHVVFRDSITIHFNGEDIRIFHLPNGHTDCDVFVYFPRSGVIHMGDTYFNEMFPAVYKEGGGDILQLVKNMDYILNLLPEQVKFIPGHGSLATKSDFRNYVTMLKETTEIVSAGIKSGKTLQQLQDQKVLSKYDKLGSGGAQTTDQYLAMLYKLLSR